VANRKTEVIKLTINQLSQITGKTFRTIKERLSNLEPVIEDGTGTYYETIEALPLIFEIEGGKKKLSLHDARAILTMVQTEKAKVELHKMKGLLVVAEDVEKKIAAMVVAIRSKFLNVPNKAMPIWKSLKKDYEFEQGLRELIEETLIELSDYRDGPGDRPDRDAPSSIQPSKPVRSKNKTTAKKKDKRVDPKRKKATSNKRGTGKAKT